jgi:hypothetical protein
MTFSTTSVVPTLKPTVAPTKTPTPTAAPSAIFTGAAAKIRGILAGAVLPVLFAIAL